MKLSTKEIVIFAMLGALMYTSKVIMEWIPNVHLLGILTVSYTIVYQKKALYPIYIFVFILGLLNGFSVWWIPHLYIWTLLWGVVVLLPKDTKPFYYIIICAMHGFLYGTLYSPAQALFFNLDFKQTIAWIMTGLPWDFVHGVSNLAFSTLIFPIVKVLKRSIHY